ncbi:MAG: ABC transporter ATP-binding protein, partial [Puniceicoccales bacterium]|nr:ABC transporter ATP-binding protein [Puniceicoccales bacterium]
MGSPPLLNVQDLHIRFQSGNRETEVVKGISFSIQAGKILAVVGESGSGKSVSALSLTRLLPPPPSCKITGLIEYQGRNILELSAKELRQIRGKEIAYIFQEPGTSLNPSYTVGFQIAEAIRQHIPSVKNIRDHIINALEEVGIREASARVDAYPHELSGGMQQRVMIAMALACKPRLLIADEPTTALDVTIQKQIMELLASLRQKHDMAIMLITHNFGVVAHFADEVAVMFRGEIVERGITKDILASPQHPYTQALIACIPRLGQQRRRLVSINDG